MFDQLKSKKIEVSITKGNSPEDCVLKGIDNLGGFSKFIEEGDQVFIKFNLSLPGGFPVNTNPNTLGAIISSCKEAAAKKILLGSFPTERVSSKIIYDYVGIQKYIESFGAELTYLDNSDYYEKKALKQEELKMVKDASLSKIKIKDKEYLVPRLILDSDKFIVVNQVNVNPLFKINLSLLNLYSIIPALDQEIEGDPRERQENVSIDKFKKDLMSNILDVFTIKQPDLVINDMFYLLEGAGPSIYKDSQLKKTGMMVAGNNPIAVDLITLKVLNIETDNLDLIQEARNANIEIPSISNIKIIGDKLTDLSTDIYSCVSKLKDINVRSMAIKSGEVCSGCFKQAYHLLNLMKTYLVKDLKYNPINSFLIGKTPSEPKNSDNVLLFGDCAINTTKTHNFRKLIIESKKTQKIEAKNKSLLRKKPKNNKKVKEISNKKILEIPGCPPNLYDCIELMIKYYGKSNVPNLNLLQKINNQWISGKMNEILKTWEAL